MDPTPSAVAADDSLRSRYIQLAIADRYAYGHRRTGSLPPRVVVQFWDDEETIPADVRECMETWSQLYAHGFERRFFDDDRARRFIGTHYGRRCLAAFNRCTHPAMRSDYFRLCYVLKNGGLYVDADDVYLGVGVDHLFQDGTLKLRPLCYDTRTDAMVEETEFIAGAPNSAGWIFYVNNNPLIAPPGHPILRLALERSTRLLLGAEGDVRDVQSITGPGNLTASLVRQAAQADRDGEDRAFVLLADWDTVSVSQWPLEYRGDERNWRLWVGDRA